MNDKIKFSVAALAAATAVALSGCTGCGGTTTTANTLARSNWFTGTSYGGIQPSFIITDDDKTYEQYAERLVYDVTYDASGAKNANLSVEYADGEFTTEFYATEYDWTNSAIPDGYAYKGKEIVYVYKTKLDIKVKYAMKTVDGASTDWFEDGVETISYFRAAAKNLAPVYSKQTIKSTSPADYQPKTLEEAYKKIEIFYENFYNFDCTKILSRTTENGKSTAREYADINKAFPAVFDNSSLYIAVRSLKLSSSLSQLIALFSPAAGGVDGYEIVGSDSGLTQKERDGYTALLSGKGLYVPSAADGEKDKGVETTAVTVSYAGGELRGTSQTIWYASILNADDNVSRATMLKLSVPLSFGLGTLDYSLKEIKSTLWNG